MKREWIAYVIRRSTAAGNDSGHIYGLRTVTLDRGWAFHPDDALLLAASPELADACEEFERYFSTDQPDIEKMKAHFRLLKQKMATALAKLRGQQAEQV